MNLIRLFIASLNSCFSLFCETVPHVVYHLSPDYRDFHRYPAQHNGLMHALMLSKYSLITKKSTVIGKTYTDKKLKSFEQICYVSLYCNPVKLNTGS